MTPLLPSRQVDGLWWKDESKNPTGASKDRALAVAVSKGLELGAQATILASTGSAGISAAAYSARAGLLCAVLLPKGTPADRLKLMTLFGAQVIQVDGSYEQLMTILARARDELGWYEVSTYRSGNPHQAEGPKTIAYEIAEEMSASPDAVIVPVGGGGTLAGIYRGFCDLLAAQMIERLPRIYAVQNEKFNALEQALAHDLQTASELADLGLDPDVPVATVNLKHAVPPDGVEALSAIRASGGGVVTVTDVEAFAAQEELAATEGILVEVSSAVALAAFRKLRTDGRIAPGERTVALLTGSALRDLSSLTHNASRFHEGVRPEACLDVLQRLRRAHGQ